MIPWVRVRGSMNRIGAIVLLTVCIGVAGCGGGSGQQGAPVVQLSQTALSFVANFGVAYTPVVTPVNVTNTGSGTLKFTATSDSSWLVVTPGSGLAPQSLSVSVAPGSLTVGPYTGHVTVTATGAQAPATITVTFAFVQAPANAPFCAQWGADPQHAGMVSVAAQGAVNQLANIVYDPFVAQEQAENGGSGGDGG